MFHAFINVAVFPTLRAGGQVITVPKFEPSTYIEALSRYKVIQIEQHTILLANINYTVLINVLKVQLYLSAYISAFSTTSGCISCQQRKSKARAFGIS